VLVIKSRERNVKTMKREEEECKLMTKMPKLARKETKNSPPLSFSCPL
jgi:hypothetical protein